MSLQVGTRFDQLEVKEHIAEGGSGNVYRVRDLATKRDMALKIPDAMLLGDLTFYERFRRELEVVKLLDHPGIQKCLKTGEYNRTPYLITELIDGQSLRTLIETDAPFAPDRTLYIIRALADAVAYCHDQDIIHRDLKPENVLVCVDDQPILIDFGLVLTKTSRRVTHNNFSMVAGTPDYMSPERLRGQRGDKRSDVYAIGLILYEMLTGKLPFESIDYAHSQRQAKPFVIPRLDQKQAGVSPQLAAVVTRCLQPIPDDRYPDMRAFLYSLEHLATEDTSILDQPVVPSAKPSIFRSLLNSLRRSPAILVIGWMMLAVLTSAIVMSVI